MQRALFRIAAAASVCGSVYLLLQFLVENGVAAEQVVLFAATATLVLAGTAAAFATAALMRSAEIRSEVARIARSLDAALAAMPTRTNPQASPKSAAEAPAAARPTPGDPISPAVAPPDDRSNVVSLPKRRFRPEIVVAAARSDTAEPSDVWLKAAEAAIHSGPPTLVLRPLWSVARGTTAGFDVLVHLDDQTDSRIVTRLDAGAPSPLRAAFERWMLSGATEAIRRGTVGVRTRLPMHVAVSDALLLNGRELAAAVDLLAAVDAPADITLVLPVAVLAGQGVHQDAVSHLRKTGVQIAAEDWLGDQAAFETLAADGITSLRTSSQILLGRQPDRILQAPPTEMIERAAARGLPLIATDVGDEADAVAMMDFGIGTLSGPFCAIPARFADPLARDAAV